MSHSLYALFVGINDYPEPVGKLSGCVNDVKAFHQWLEGRVAGEFCLNAQFLLNEQAKREAVINGFREHLRKAGPQDIAIFYYSGHGSQEQAPREFYSIEPDRLDETLVCYDSRLEDGWDLADKELSILIAEVASSGAHVLVILDCCHSGSGTREACLSPAGIRWTPADARQRPLESFIDPLPRLVNRSLEENRSEFLLPQGRHILLAACRPEETAKEYAVEGQKWGAFSYFLHDTLSSIGRSLTYRDLFNQVCARVRASISQQTPQLEAVYSEDVDRPFLGGAVAERPPYFTAYFESFNWRLNGGSIHGLKNPIGNEQTALALFPIDTPVSEMYLVHKAVALAFVQEVQPQSSRLEIRTGALNPSLTYKAIVTSAPLPTVSVRLEGEAEGIALARAALEQAAPDGKPSLFVRLVESEADVLLLAQDGQYLLVRPSDGHTLATFPIGYSDETARQAVQRLEHIARWITVRDLDNPLSGLSLDALRLTILRDGMEMPPQEMLFSYRYEGGRWRKPAITVQVRNTSNRSLYCTALALGEDFSISCLFTPQPVIRLEPGQEYSQQVFGSVPDNLWRQGITDYQDILKLIVCTDAFDARLLEQGSLDTEHKIYRSADTAISRGPLNRLMHRLQTRTLSTLDEDEVLAEWRTEQAVLTIRRPLDTYVLPRSGEAVFLGWGVIVEPHAALSGRLRLGRIEASSRDLRGPGLPPILASQSVDSQPFAFQITRGLEPSPNMIELTDVDNYEAVTPQSPLRLLFSTSLREGEHVLAYGYDGEFFLPLGVAQATSMRETRLDICRLPPPVSNSRDLQGSIRIYFQKVIGQPLGIPYPYPILAAAIVNPQGQVTYQTDPTRVRQQVRDAQRITIYIHGLTGDTRRMLASALRVAPGDLLLSFDYESFNTSIEENARLLGQRLAEVGLKAGHQKQVRLVAHSLGGVLARWFIEREGGKDVVQRLVTLGSPHAGTPWSTIQEWATLAIAFALNSMTTLTWPLSILSLLLGWLEKNDVSLDQIKPGSDFLQNLNTSEDPHLPYCLIAGNTSLASEALAGEAKSRFARLAKRLGYGAATLAFFGQPNDIAVSVYSASAVPRGREPQPQRIEIPCDHVQFFNCETGLQALASALGPG